MVNYSKIKDEVVNKYSILKRKGKINSSHVMVFDIDDTLIDSFSGKAIISIVDLYKFFLNKGHKIYILTARDPYFYNQTKDELRRVGVSGYSDLIMVGTQNKGYYKKKARKDIERGKVEILFNIGDSDSDFEGGYYDYAVKL